MVKHPTVMVGDPTEGALIVPAAKVGADVRQRELGWRVHSAAVGRYAAEHADPRFADKYSIILAPQETDLGKQVQAFLRWVEDIKADIVIPTYEGSIIAAIPHLPPHVRYITICHNVISAFVVSTAYRERLSCVVAQNYVEVKRLKNRWKLPPEKIRFIRHGINLKEFHNNNRDPRHESLNLIFVGRINHGQKGVLWLPLIMKELTSQRIPASLQVVGDSPVL